MTVASRGVRGRWAGAAEDLVLLAAAVYLLPLSIVLLGLPIVLVVWLVRAVAASF